MKLLVFILLLFPASLFAQNTLYLSFQPCDLGAGLRYDRQIKNIDLYTSLTKGNYRIADNFIKDHYKASAGVVIRNISFGLSYHKYGEIQGTFNRMTKYSCEFGGKTTFDKWSVALRFDPIKFEGTAEIGIKF
jgi:hypothetical protein